ncbi:phage distal tail protein [Amycolatopsis sp. H20-H5]|uniref:phage distal tail protein n=1 Tax=Amycolatopsis sp. H20-H5 TaxID=3046309 RepID=UPI002DB59034|nr:hypothetical protein [Amycolatopsis sp. H20-H5]MEC3974733.1 hypothetical protein [Amycolatopsis sp. H20-H5]
MPTPALWPNYAIGSWSANVTDDFGCLWVVVNQTLNDGVGRKTHTTERPFGPGAYRDRSYPAARIGTMQGWCQAPDRAGREAARDRLMAVLADGGQAPLVVSTGNSTRQLLVELNNDAPKCDVWKDAQGFDWQLSLYAADPRYVNSSVRAVSTTIGGASTDGLDWAAPGPQFISAGVASEGSNAPRTPGMPAGIVAGDTLLLLAAIRNSGAGTVDTPAGYTLLSDGSNLRLFGKVYDGVESAPTVTFTGGVVNATNSAQMSAFRGLSLTVLNAATQLNGSVQDIAYPAVTVPTQRAVVLYVGWKQAINTGVATIAGATEIGDISTVTGSGASIVWDYTIQGTAPANIAAGSFTVSGGTAAISRGAVVALDGNVPGAGLDWLAGTPGGLDWGTSGSGGPIVMDNPGSAITWPTFTFTGPLVNPSVTDPATGNTVAYNGTVAAGQTLVIDCSPFTRSVKLNGIDRSGALSSAQWISIPAGGTTVAQFAGTGVGTLTATWQYAYN